MAFSASSSSTLERSSTHYKDGTHSMKWTWTSGNEFTHTISPAISGSEGKAGGIKLWLYNPHKRTAGEHLTVSFSNSAQTVSQFNITLNFKGWRAVWVSYDEGLLNGRADMTTMRITAPTTSETAHPLYFDLIRLVEKLSRQSRDKVVPTLDPDLYNPNNFWQQTYRWSQAMTMSIEAEASPKGLWALNYAALVVYRRSDWAVSVKGFNNYVWDFEASGNQNVYGIYQSHGALLVANSEAALQTHDTDNGWDWTRHPGTTTIKLPLADLISGSNRFSSYFPFNYSPTHKLINSPIVFEDNLHGKMINNTLLPQKFPLFIEVSTVEESRIHPSIEFLYDIFRYCLLRYFWREKRNGYYIPKATEQGLNVKVSLQTSRNHRGKKDTSARYATTWLDHGANPTAKGYEYAILVDTQLSELQAFATQQTVYEVIHKDNNAHAVKFNNFPRQNENQWGYAFFHKSARTPGPVRRVTKHPTLVMFEEDDENNVYVSVSYPNLNFNISEPLTTGNRVSGQERFYSVSTPIDIEVGIT
ncbi:unnamed protein product [Porites evermanni]|uniref:Uncharacterized protein n=1 Tax=Porites evermanni TaxID=104178 RepID=A0ABN8MAJ4_9CNID|nr:unnamed protein product [Porites evermanni]